MKHFLLAILAILSFGAARAVEVDTSQKTTWKVSATPAGAGMYNIVFHVDLGYGWHTWALSPGVDKKLVPPSFSIDPATAAVMGPASEQGITSDMQMPGYEGYVRLYNSEAMFFVPVKAAKGKTVKGSYTFQRCRGSKCLPPQTETFKVKLP